MTNSATTFVPGNIDFSDVSDADLNPPQRLRQEGVFTMTLNSYEFSPKKKDGSHMAVKVDAAGNRFHPLKVNLGVDIDGQAYTADKLMFVPVDSAWYLKAEGAKPTMVFATGIRDFLQSLIKEPISAQNLGVAISNINETLEKGIGDTVIAKNALRSKEKIIKAGDDCFQVQLANGSLLETDEGDVVEADSYEGVRELYKQVRGAEFQAGYELKNFYLPKS